MTRVRKKVFLSIFIVLFTLIIGYKTGYVYAEAPHDQNFDDVTGYGVGSCQIGDLNFITDDNLSIEVKGSDALSYAASDAINAGGNIAGFSGSGICNDNSFSSNPTKIGFECANGSSTFKLESLYALVSKISDSSTSVDITGYHVSGGSKEVYAHIAGVDFTKPGATQYIDDAGYPVTFSGNVNSDTANDGYGEYGGLLTFGSDWYDINRVEFTRFDPVSGTNKVLYISLDSIDLSNLTDISVGDITVDEDKNAEFTVNLTKPYDKDLTVDYSFADGKAKAGEDYTAIGGTVIIPAKALSAPIMVPINDDSDFEEAEDFYINLSNPSVGGLADSQAQCIITDNDHRPKVKLSLDNSSINENGGKTKIKADLSNKSYQDVTVNLNFSGTAAAAGYTASSTQITIPAGQLSGYVDISAKDNNTYDGENKILTADITGPVNADKDDFQPPSLEIIDNETEPQVSLSLLGDTISEDGSKKAKVTAALSNPSFEDVTVYLDFSDAELGKDFTTDNKIVIPAGQSSNFIEIQGIENSVFNFNKTLKISMASVENGFPSGDPVTATVANDEAAPVVTMEKAEINEKDSDTNKAVFKVSIPEASGEDVTVYYTTSDGSAKEGKDYTGVVMGKLTIPKGQTSEDIKIDVLNDEIDEDDETFTVSLSNPEGATIGTPSQTCTITDDDNAPYITIGGNPVYEGDTGTGTNYMIFDVTLSAESGKKVSVNYSTADDTATQGSDYEAVTGNLTFNPGETSKQVKVKIIGDDTKEQDETFLLKLTASNAADTDYQATGTILNDDDPLLSINDMSVKEGDTGNKITFTVSLSKPSADSVTVDYKTVDGTAVSGKDYVSKDGTITFDKNETQKTITIDVNDDTIYEDDETFYVDLSNSSVAITKARGTGTIQDNDPKPSITIKNISVDEGSSGSTDAEFTIIMSSESSKAVTVNYITEDGSAKAGADYEKAQGVLTFVPGETEKKITVKIAADTVDEDDESFDLILSDAAGADLGASTATCTITDDDAAPGISIGDCTVKEGDSGYAELVFDVTLSEASGKQVSVDYSTSDGTAVQGTDYVAASGKLTFNPGETSKQIKVNVIGDINLETDKNLTVNLTNLVNTQALDVTGEGTIKDDDLPVIKITGKDTNGDAKEIVNGDTTPSLEDNTDFGTVVTGDAKTITREFTITNTGNSELTLTGDKPYVTIDGDNKADFTVVTGPAISIKGGASTTFSITFKPSKAQQETATVTITSNDAANSPFVFTIKGEGTVPPPSGGGSTTPSTQTTPSNPPTKQERLNISFGDNSSKEVIADVLDENNVRTTKIDLDEAQVPK
ncbi:MAG TPA: Calx-beta domain-containing protein, partial [Ruminiclostridium sp.]|nr:Calx-beta domain-containing protein [Ruminiclostridium sp.]